LLLWRIKSYSHKLKIEPLFFKTQFLFFEVRFYFEEFREQFNAYFLSFFIVHLPHLIHMFELIYKNFVYIWRREWEVQKKNVDACDEGEAANTRMFIYANGIRSRLIVRPHTLSDSLDGQPGDHSTCQSCDKGTRDGTPVPYPPTKLPARNASPTLS